MAIVDTFFSARRSLAKQIEAFRHNESGATAIEYGLIVSLIFLAVVGSVRAFTSSTSDVYGEIEGAMASTIE